MAELQPLETQLIGLASELEYPTTPEFVRGFRLLRPLRPVPLRGMGHLPTRWGGLAAAAAALVLVGLVAYPQSRDALAEWLHLHTQIQRVQHPPTPSPLPPGKLGENLGLGSHVTLEDARSAVTWHLLVPSKLGAPDEVYLQSLAVAQGEVSLVYATQPDIQPANETGIAVLVTEAKGAVNADFFGKIIGPGTTLEEVTVNGRRGYWISGKPHGFFFIDATGNTVGETLRLATNTLLLDVGGTVVRIEGNMTKAQAEAIAASLS